MNRLASFCLLGAAALAGGCTMNGDRMGAMTPPPAPATAMLTGATGTVMGTATLTPMKGGIRLVVEGMGLTPGAHGVHVHAIGRCEAPDFASAGPHWNPNDMKHGKDAPGGPHMGDAPNMMVGADGTGKLEAMLPGTLTGTPTSLLDADGASVVIHAAADDYKTDPSGNSGGRIACGAVTAG